MWPHQQKTSAATYRKLLLFVDGIKVFVDIMKIFVDSKSILSSAADVCRHVS